MKTIRHTFFPISFGLFASLPALAIEPPKDDAPPPPSVKTPGAPAVPEAPQTAANPSARAVVAKPNVIASAGAFIGLITAELPEMLSVHLGMKPGDGVIIRDLSPAGPAEQAGFSRYDVITRVGGESVGSPIELSQKIGAKKPGEEISIDLIHEGKAETKTVKLGTRPAEAGRVEDPRQLGHLNFDDMPGEQAQRLRQMIEGRLNGRMSEAEAEPRTPQGNFKFNSNATFRLMDAEGSVEVKSSNGSKDITVRDHENAVTWSGPWNTEEDKAAAPAKVRDRIQRFKFDDSFGGSGLRLQLGQKAPGLEADE